MISAGKDIYPLYFGKKSEGRNLIGVGKTSRA